VPLRLESSVTDISVRAIGYGIPGVSVDGMDLLAVYGAARPAVERARAGEGPTLIEARTYRYMPNTSNDDDTRYRERAEVEQWRERDPVAFLRARLLREKGVEEARLERLEQDVADEVVEAATWGEAQPDAEADDVLRHTWADVDAAVPGWAELSAR
ncbi:MAG TPA: thiamine pyrophosphate-dependent enzyme, partial [Chloroflexota bacterium]|nr:thiamine pyrophosphate-dependent enzyme [Chloroflexota bacterium]